MFTTKHLQLGFLILLNCLSMSLFANADKSITENAFGVILEEFPSNKHFYPRNLTNNKGTAVIKGKAYGISSYEQVRVKLYKEGTLSDTFEQTLNYQGNIANFTFNIPINAELSNHKLVLMGVNNGVETIEASADEVVAGDVYVINGQSNAVASASVHPSDLNYFMRSYTSANGWNYINLSFPGQWGGRLAKRIIDEKQIPVAIFNEAQGAQQISFFQKNDSSPTAGNYGALRTRLINAGVADDVRAIIWFQGESDGWTVSTEEYKTAFLNLYNDWKGDYSPEEIYLFQIRYQACSSVYPYILEAHRQSADELYDVHIMSTNNTFHDGCHYPYENGYKVLGDRLYGLINRDMYGDSSSNITAPDVSGASVNDDQITITMSGTNSLTVIGNPWSDFRLEGGNVNITGGSVSGSTIKLNLSGAAAGVTGVSYLGHPGNADNWIVNPNEVGILSFYNFPISNPIPGGGGGGGNTGSSIDCNNISITTTSNGVTISGLDEAPITQVKIFNTNWNTAFSCSQDCESIENISLSSGDYYVYVKYYNSDWTLACEVNENINVGGGTTVIDNDNDGVPAEDDCNDNNPSIPATPGTSCNDNNTNTTNDVIQEDGCTCAGTTNNGGGGSGNGTIDCANISLTADGTTIQVAGLGTAPISKLQIFDEGWSIVFNCYGDCEDTITIDLSEGVYRVRAALNNSNWQEVCEINEEIILENGTSTGGGGGENGGGGNTANGVDLELNMTVAESEYIIYEHINYTLTLVNNGADAATEVEVENQLPAGTVYSDHVASNGSEYSPWNSIWKVGTVDPGETIVLQLKLFVLSDDQDIRNFAQVASANGTDADSTPGNNNTNTPNEDDEAVVSLEAGTRANEAIGISFSQNRFLVLTNLYPNPASTILNLEIVANADATEQVQIFDARGSLKQVVTYDIVDGRNQFQLDIADFATGMYFILFDTNNRHEPIRFVKQRL